MTHHTIRSKEGQTSPTLKPQGIYNHIIRSREGEESLAFKTLGDIILQATTKEGQGLELYATKCRTPGRRTGA